MRAVLQLNAAYEPTRIVSGRRALELITRGKAVVVVGTDREVYPGVYAPSVIRLLVYKHVPIRLKVLSKRNLHMRDNHRCAYCLKRCGSHELSLDHIIPKSHGGADTWDNLVTACKKCNHRKNDRTPEQAEMPLKYRPLPRTVHTSRFVLRSMGEGVEEWNQYLYHDNAGDRRFSWAG